MIKFEMLSEVLLAKEEKITIQKVVNKNKFVNRKQKTIRRETFARNIEQLQESGKEIEVWCENNQEWTVRAVDVFGEDTTEFKVKKLREVVAC